MVAQSGIMVTKTPNDSTSLPFTSVVVPVYNGESVMKNCLESMMKLKYPSEKLEVIVVDDGSTDKTVDIVRGYPVKLICKGRGGYPSTMNAGISVAKGEIIVIVDSDTYLDEDWLIKVVEEFEDPVVGMVSGYFVTPPNSSFLAKVIGFAAEDCYDRIKSKYLDFITTACTAYRKKLFAEIGLFHETLRRGSDEDLAHRAFKAGWKIVLRKDAISYHQWESSIKKYFIKQALTTMYQVKLVRRYPELLYGKKEHPISLYIPLLLTFFLILTPVWLWTNNLWISLASLGGLILYHLPQTVRIIRKHKEWVMLVFPFVFTVRYVAWLLGLLIGMVKKVEFD